MAIERINISHNELQMHDKQDFFYEDLMSGATWDDITNPYETARRLDLIFNQLIKPSELERKSLLDAGSGGGHFSETAGRMGARIFSLDIGLNLLKGVEQRCRSEKILGSTLALPFRKSVFDIVLSTEVIEHTPQPLSAVKELAQIVKPGGLLIITTPSRLWNPIVNLATTLKLRPYEGHENFIWPKDLVGVLTDLKFTIDSVVGFNFCPVFSRKIDLLFRGLDRLYGKRLPWLMVNFAVRARRR